MRPKLIPGDRFRFRSDGEIGEMNKSCQLNTETFHTVKRVLKNGRIDHEDGGSYAAVQCEICNDFSNIATGDRVQLETSLENGGIYTVMRVSDTHFSFNKSEFHYEYPKTGEWINANGGTIKIRPLRIVEKAPRRLLADAQVGDILMVESANNIFCYEQISYIGNGYIHTDNEMGGFAYDVDTGIDLDANAIVRKILPLAPEGTAEWAWQMMLLGKEVTVFDQPNRHLRILDSKIKDSNVNGFWNGKGYIDFKNSAVKTGWQIYNEPEPLLADAKVGWLCEMSDGTYNQIKEIVEKPNLPKRFVLKDEVRCKHKGSNAASVTRAFQEDGTYYSHFCGKEPEFTTTIISCEPLAAEGTAEWAWQMNKLLGKRVMHAHSNRITEGNITDTNKDMFLAITFDTGWQLYSPQPQVEVGDWVKRTHAKHVCYGRVITNNSDTTGMLKLQYTDGDSSWAYASDYIVIHPAEVVVTLTLSGTVSEFDDDGDFELRFGDSKNDYHVININALTPADAELVRGLTGGGE